METCPICLGNGKRFEEKCYLCDGNGFIGKITRKEMVDFISHETEKAGFQIILENSQRTKTNGIECSAFFDFRLKILAVAALHENFFENLLHEFCHLRQFQLNCKVWADSYTDGNDTSDILDSFLNGMTVLNDDELEIVIDKIIDLEWDCENRVKEYLRMIEGYSVDSLATYDINAFMYMRFYRAVQYFKKWNVVGKDFLSMGIHKEYIDKILPLYCRANHNSPIKAEEIEIYRKCFE